MLRLGHAESTVEAALAVVNRRLGEPSGQRIGADDHDRGHESFETPGDLIETRSEFVPGSVRERPGPGQDEQGEPGASGQVVQTV
jgi:hypothetical protein